MTDVQGLGWLENTVACSVTLHTWGNTKGVKAADVSQYSGQLADHAAKKRISVTKRLLECKEYQKIISLDGHAGRYFKEHSVPSMFRHGVYAVPTVLLEEWIAYLDTYSRDREQLVSDFGFAFDQAVSTAEQELGSLFRSEEYPATGQVISKFSVEVRYIELGVPGKLQLVSPQAFEQAQRELEATVSQGKAYLESLMCEEITSLVTGLRTALQGLDDGTLKRFHESHVTKVQDWANLFLEARNVTDDQELAAVVQKLGATVAGIETEAVKKFAFIRKDIKAALDGSLLDLKGMLEARPGRLISLDND